MAGPYGESPVEIGTGGRHRRYDRIATPRAEGKVYFIYFFEIKEKSPKFHQINLKSIKIF